MRYFKFNDMDIEFEPCGVWKEIVHFIGIGSWYEARWSSEPETTIQLGLPMDFRFGFENAAVYDNASIEGTLSSFVYSLF